MNIQNLMAQAQKMQKELSKKIKEFEEQVFEYDYKNGSVVIQIEGTCKIISLKINKILIDSEDPTTLEEMVEEAVNHAVSGVLADKKQIEQSVNRAGQGMF
jgi:DNA-binding YbaB/EbfC family protein